MKHLHEATHYVRDSLTMYIKLWLTNPGISKAIQKVIARCVVCQKNNPTTDRHQKKEGKKFQGRACLKTGKYTLPRCHGPKGGKIC